MLISSGETAELGTSEAVASGTCDEPLPSLAWEGDSKATPPPDPPPLGPADECMGESMFSIWDGLLLRFEGLFTQGLSVRIGVISRLDGGCCIW